MEKKECPLCGAPMRLSSREQTDLVPGTRESRKSHIREWVCPECDYFEDAEES